MSQLDLEQLEYSFDNVGGLDQPAPGKATLTSRLGRSASGDAGLEGGQAEARSGRGIGDGGDGGGGAGAGGGRRGLSFLGGGAEVGADGGRAAAAPAAGRGLEYLGDVGGSGFAVAAKLDASGARPDDDAVHALAAASTGGGSALPTGLRGSLESATGTSLSGVRVHTDEHAQTAASSINARAYASGDDIHFGAGQYDPSSAGGQHLIAHEVAHTIQQSAAPRAKAEGGAVSVSAPGDSFEVEADRFADAFVAGNTAPISSGASTTTAFRAPTPGPAGAPPPGKEGARGPDGRREFPKNEGPPPASMGRTVQPPSAPVKPGDPGANVKAPPGPPLPAQPLTAKPGAPGAVIDPKAKKADKGDAGKDGGKDKGDHKADGKGGGDHGTPTKAPKHPAGGPAIEPVVPTAVPKVNKPAAVVMDEPGNITEHEIKQWVQKTGRGPADHHAEVQGILSTLNSEITSKQAELESLGKDLKAQQDALTSTRVATFEAQLATGKGTVTAAFDKITNGLSPLAIKAKAAVEASRVEGEGKLKAAESTKKAELTASFKAAETAVTNLSTTQAGPYEKILTDFSKGLTEAGDFSKKAVDIESTNIVNNNKPNDCAGLGVPAARESLRASIKQEAAKNTGKDAKKKIDGIVNPAAADIAGKAKKTVQDLIKPYKDTLDAEVKKTQTAADGNFTAATKSAKDQLNAGAVEGNAAIDKAVNTTKGNINAEKTTSLGIIDGAAKTATGACKSAGAEISNRIEGKANKDAAELGALLEEARGLVKGKRVNADKVKPKLDDILADAIAMHAAATAGLTEMLTKGKTELDGVIVKQEGVFAAAVTLQTEQATEVETKSQKEVNSAAEGFAKVNASTAQGFDDTIGKDIAKVTAATATFNTTATAGLLEQQTLVRDKLIVTLLPEAKKQLSDIAKSIPDEAAKGAEAPTEAKSKGASGKASKLRSCMDGWGTDESGIFGQLRDASYGEIELIEATYDEHYAHRAGKGMSPLRYDLWDEMSGNELAIARAYLDHDRDTAIKLELQDCCGWNDDEERIEAILRSASDEELKTLATKEKGTLDLVRDNLGGCDLDTVDALLDTNMDRDRRMLKADAIRVFDAMEGIGTDEAKVKALLEQCQTEEQRKALREEFNKYAAKEGWGVSPKRDKNGALVIGEDGNPVMMDALDSAIADDFSGHEANLVHALAEEQRDETKIRVAKALFGGEGLGTDEHLMFEALDDDAYADAYEKATPEQQKLMREQRAKDMNSKFADMSDYKDMGALLDNDMGSRGGITYEEIEAGQTKSGEKINDFHRSQVNLEREVAQAKMDRGRCPPSLQLRYAVFGDGTDEKLIKDCLAKGGDPLPKSRIAEICTAYKHDWNRTLASHNELDVLDYTNFKGPSGDLNSDLSGDDWFDVRMLLCGKPETAEEMRYISKARVHYKTGGVAGDAFMQDAESIGYTDTRKDLLAQDKRFDELYQSIPPELRNAKLSVVAQYMGTKTQAVGQDGKPLKGPDGQPLPDDVFERYCEYLQADADAYGAAKASFIDAIVTALEIIGGVLVTIATAGASSPVLAAIIGNLIISAGGIMLKRAALGDAYGADRFFEDAAMALVSAGVAAAEAKAFSKVATGVANKLVKVEAIHAAEEAGVELAEGGIKVASKGRQMLNRMIQSGVKTVMSEAATTVGQTLLSEEFWNSKLSDSLWGENSLGAKLLMGVPKSMAAGMVRGALEPFTSSRKSYAGSALASGLTNIGANTAGILCYVDSYDDATAFWNEMLKSNAGAFVRGVFDGAAGHKARAKNLAEDFVSGRESAEDLAPRAEYLSPDEMKTIAAKAAASGKGHELPEAFKKYLPATTAPAGTTAPGPAGGGDPPPPPPPPAPAHNDDNNPPPPPPHVAPADETPPPAGVHPSPDAPPPPPPPAHAPPVNGNEVDPNANANGPHPHPVVDPNAPHPNPVVDPNAAHTDPNAPHPIDPNAPHPVVPPSTHPVAADGTPGAPHPLQAPHKTTLDVVNTGTHDELMTLPGMDAETANKIIAGRSAGKYTTMADLSRADAGHAAAKLQHHANEGMLDVINQGNADQIKHALGIDDAAAQALVEERDRRKAAKPNEPPFGNIGNIASIGGITKHQAGELQAKQKWGQIELDDGPASALKGEFKAAVDALKADPANAGKSEYDLMKDVVAADTAKYCHKGDPVPLDVLQAHGAFSRVIGMTSVYEYHMTAATKADLAAMGITTKEQFAAAVAADPSIFKASMLDTSSKVSGKNGVAWWAPKGNSTAGTAAELVGELALDPKYYQGGLVRVSMDPEAMAAGGFKKPTPFDGINFGEWISARGANPLGVTGGGAPEAVAPSLSLSQLSKVEVFAGAAPGTAAVMGGGTTGTGTGTGDTTAAPHVTADTTPPPATVTPAVADTTPTNPAHPNGAHANGDVAPNPAHPVTGDAANSNTPAVTHPNTAAVDPAATPRKPRAQMTHEERLADDQTHGITPAKRAEFDEIDQLATLATSPSDWEYIRDLETRAGRPPHDQHPGPAPGTPGHTPVAPVDPAHPTPTDPNGGGPTAARAIPGTDFHGSARPVPDAAAVQALAHSALDAIAKKLGTTATDGVMEIEGPGGVKRKIRIEVVPSAGGDAAPVATYDPTQIDGTGEIVIKVSNQALDEHVARAVAHDVTEVKHRLKTGDSGPDGADALAAGATATALSPHDLGRLAELDVMADQMRAARKAGDKDTVARLQADAEALMNHLGLDGNTPEAQNRRKLANAAGSKATERLKELVTGERYTAMVGAPAQVQGAPKPPPAGFEELQTASGIGRKALEALARGESSGQLSVEEQARLDTVRAKAKKGEPLTDAEIRSVRMLAAHAEADPQQVANAVATARTQGDDASASETRPPLSSDAQILDSNIASVLDKAPADVKDSEAHLKKAADETTNPAALDLTHDGEGSPHKLPADTRADKVPLTVTRDSPEFEQMVATMVRYAIGTEGGNADRAIAAEAFFAHTADGSTPTLKTGDARMATGLLRAAGIDPDGMNPPWHVQYAGGFLVELHGRKLTVIFVPPPAP